MSAAQAALSTRVCGSPAVDGYAHVKPDCLEASPTAKWWREYKPKPEDLDIHIERGADYDGLAGGRQGGVCDCSAASRQYVGEGCMTAVQPARRDVPPAHLETYTAAPSNRAAMFSHPCSGLGNRQHKGEHRGVRRGVSAPRAQGGRYALCAACAAAACCCPPLLAAARRLAAGWAPTLAASSLFSFAAARCNRPPLPAAGVFSRLPCNAFAWCGHEKCFEPDAHTHSKGDCWCVPCVCSCAGLPPQASPPPHQFSPSARTAANIPSTIPAPLLLQAEIHGSPSQPGGEHAGAAEQGSAAAAPHGARRGAVARRRDPASWRGAHKRHLEPPARLVMALMLCSL